MQKKLICKRGHNRIPYNLANRTCRLCIALSNKRYNGSQKRKDYLRNYELKAKYGITTAQWETMFYLQQGGCAICGRKDSGKRNLSVDHDHVTGKVRGLLCQTCNAHVLIAVERYSHLFDNAKEYLRRSKCPNFAPIPQ